MSLFIHLLIYSNILNNKVQMQRAEKREREQEQECCGGVRGRFRYVCVLLCGRWWRLKEEEKRSLCA